MHLEDLKAHLAIQKFIRYLQINTVQPTPDYVSCTAFLREYAQELGLGFAVHELVKGKPIVVMTLKGRDESLPSVILNSHTDVVPVSPELWTYPPFSAHMDDKGDIFARGAQDMKCVAIWYLEAIRALQAAGSLPLRRTIHLTFVPDEEIGGDDGMKIFLTSPEFKSLNAGFALDEGLANETDGYKVYYGERFPWWIKLKATGAAGHGSKFIEPSATISLLKVLEKFVAFRDSEKTRMDTCETAEGTPFTLGDVTSTNITMLQAGVQMNVVHETAEAGIDMRVCPTADLPALLAQIEAWVHSVPGVSYSFAQYFPGAPITPLVPSNREWQVLKAVAEQHKTKLIPEIFPAATDSRYLRAIGIPALGVSAIKNTPVLLHDHNEYLSGYNFVEAIPFYVDLIRGIAELD